MKIKLFFAALIINFFASCKSEPKKEAEKENPYKNAKLDIKVFSNDSVKKSKPADAGATVQEPEISGYGYDIYMFDALYVHQPHIPAINGNRGFHTREQAQKTGEFILYKIRNNIMPPAVTVHELDSLGVLK